MDIEMLKGVIQKMLVLEMPDEMRAKLEALLAEETANAYVMQSTVMNCARKLVLSRPREEIGWNPAVDAARCIGCGVCHDFCSHGVYEMNDGKAVVKNPTGCVILCSNCMPRCPVSAITFPPVKDFIGLLKYE